MAAKNQADLVLESGDIKEAFTTMKIKVPGIDVLHTKSKQEIAEVLANVLKSQNNIVQFKYNVGQSIEVTIQNL